MKQLLIISAIILNVTLSACSGTATKKDKVTRAPEQQINTDSNTAAIQTQSDNNASLPAFTVQDVNGNTMNLQSLKGRKVFVNLWASWCPPCRREMPSIEKLSKSVDKNKVSFVMLSLDDNFDKARAFIKQQQLSLPIYYPAENLPDLFNVEGIPASFIFDENGKLIQRIDGGDDYNTSTYLNLLNK